MVSSRPWVTGPRIRVTPGKNGKHCHFGLLGALFWGLRQSNKLLPSLGHSRPSWGASGQGLPPASSALRPEGGRAGAAFPLPSHSWVKSPLCSLLLGSGIPGPGPLFTLGQPCLTQPPPWEASRIPRNQRPWPQPGRPWGQDGCSKDLNSCLQLQPGIPRTRVPEGNNFSEQRGHGEGVGSWAVLQGRGVL